MTETVINKISQYWTCFEILVQKVKLVTWTLWHESGVFWIIVKYRFLRSTE